MPPYKYKTSTGKQLWYVNFYYTDWKGERRHKCKRGFATKREAQEWEANFLEKDAASPDITFSALADNYLEDMKTRTKPTTYQSKESIIRLKRVPYFGKLKITEIDSRRVRLWQNEMMNYTDEKGKPYADLP